MVKTEHEAIRKALAESDGWAYDSDWNEAATPDAVAALLADRDRLAAALKGMHRFWSKYPAFVPAPEFMDQVCEAVEAMNAAMAEGKTNG